MQGSILRASFSRPKGQTRDRVHRMTGYDSIVHMGRHNSDGTDRSCEYCRKVCCGLMQNVHRLPLSDRTAVLHGILQTGRGRGDLRLSQFHRTALLDQMLGDIAVMGVNVNEAGERMHLSLDAALGRRKEIFAAFRRLARTEKTAMALRGSKYDRRYRVSTGHEWVDAAPADEFTDELERRAAKQAAAREAKNTLPDIDGTRPPNGAELTRRLSASRPQQPAPAPRISVSGS